MNGVDVSFAPLSRLNLITRVYGEEIMTQYRIHRHRVLDREQPEWW